MSATSPWYTVTQNNALPIQTVELRLAQRSYQWKAMVCFRSRLILQMDMKLLHLVTLPIFLVFSPMLKP